MSAKTNTLPKSFADAFHRTCRTLKSFLHSSAIIYNKVNRLRKDHAAKCPRDDCERERERLQNKLPKEGKFGEVLNPSLQTPHSINHSHFNLIQKQPFHRKNKNIKVEEEENTKSLKPALKRKISSNSFGEG